MKNVALMIILNPKKELLFQLRDDKPYISYPGFWGLFGGSIENNENEVEAVRREIREEINLEIEPIKKLGVFEVKDRNLINNVFLGKIDLEEENIRINEGQKAKFFSIENIKDLKMPEHLKEFILNKKEEILES
jgi:ADP-ribose pyrophosphatase YjhB (NUDIX family)